MHAPGCVFCASPAIPEEHQGMIVFRCPVCGEYEIAGSFLDILRSGRSLLTDADRRAVSDYIRDQVRRRCETPIFVSIGVVEGITGRVPVWRVG